MDKRAPADYPIHDLLARRWSPCGFSSRPVAADDLRAVFEAARWAPSSMNEQPWRFLVATADQPEAFARILGCLVEANQAWARFAPVLGVALTRERLLRNDAPNGSCAYDLGGALAHLTVEATARGLAVHQMGGIVREAVRAQFSIPEGVAIMTGFALGYPDPGAAHLSDKLRERDGAARKRNPLSSFVFSTWEQPADFL